MNTLPEVLYQDEDVLAINKPAGLLSIPDGYDRNLPHVAGVLSSEFGKVWIVHRLDRETSGVLLLARSLPAHRNLNIQFEHRLVTKVYHAIIVGNPTWDEIQTDASLYVNADRKHRTLVSVTHGKPARTDFRVVQRSTTCCLVEARPRTGYTHQIRAHLAALGFPILNDRLYMNFPGASAPQLRYSGFPSDLIARVALHAHSIACLHPLRQTLMELEAPYPQDFRAVVQLLNK